MPNEQEPMPAFIKITVYGRCGSCDFNEMFTVLQDPREGTRVDARNSAITVLSNMHSETDCSGHAKFY